MSVPAHADVKTLQMNMFVTTAKLVCAKLVWRW